MREPSSDNYVWDVGDGYVDLVNPLAAHLGDSDVPQYLTGNPSIPIANVFRGVIFVGSMRVWYRDDPPIYPAYRQSGDQKQLRGWFEPSPKRLYKPSEPTVNFGSFNEYLAAIDVRLTQGDRDFGLVAASFDSVLQDYPRIDGSTIKVMRGFNGRIAKPILLSTARGQVLASDPIPSVSKPWAFTRCSTLYSFYVGYGVVSQYRLDIEYL